MLLDEPFSSLDSNLRFDMQNFLKDIHLKTNTTIIFVTHDYEEAMKLSDYICVLDSGEIIQYTTPENIYKNPANIEVAKYFSKNNIIYGDINNNIFSNDSICFEITNKNYTNGKNYCCALYSQAIKLNEKKDDFEIIRIEFMGEYNKIYIKKNECALNFKIENNNNFNIYIGKKVGIKIDSNYAFIFDDKKNK